MLGVAFLQLVCAVYVQLYRLAAEYGNTQRGALECAARVKAKQRWIGRIPTPPLDPRPLSSSPSSPLNHLFRFAGRRTVGEISVSPSALASVS